MKILINNQTHEVAPDTTLQQLIESQDFAQRNIAVAVNNQLAKREAWPTMRLAEGDRVVVITAAYGG